MSCGGWGIGDKCEVAEAFAIHELEINGPGRTTQMMRGDQGEVRNIIDPPHPAPHWLAIYWNRLNETLAVPEKDFSKIKKRTLRSMF
jgi:hypothetical protein